MASLKRKTSSGYTTISSTPPFDIPVQIGGEPTLQDKSVTVTANGSQSITADSGYDGLDTVALTVNVPQPSGSTSITENGTYDVTDYASAVVNVSGATEPYCEETFNSSGYVTAKKYHGYTGLLCANNYLTSIDWGDSQPTRIAQYAFFNCFRIPSLTIPSSVTTINSYAFGTMGASLTSATVTFQGTPTTISATAFYSATKITDIYVPWASGAVANAPWGATNATIHYNS